MGGISSMALPHIAGLANILLTAGGHKVELYIDPALHEYQLTYYT